MARVQAHPPEAVDQFGHARQGPQIVEKTVGLRALEQGFLQFLLVDGVELGATAQGAALPRADAPAAALLLPAPSADATHPATSRHLGLGKTLGQEAQAFTPSLFHSVEVPPDLGVHAG
jgi:hypothetical protein